MWERSIKEKVKDQMHGQKVLLGKALSATQAMAKPLGLGQKGEEEILKTSLYS